MRKTGFVEGHMVPVLDREGAAGGDAEDSGGRCGRGGDARAHAYAWTVRDESNSHSVRDKSLHSTAVRMHVP